MSARNDITGEPIQSRAYSKQGRENYDRIFRKGKPTMVDQYHPDNVKLRDHSKHSRKRK